MRPKVVTLAMLLLALPLGAAERPTDERLNELATAYALRINPTLPQFGFYVILQRLEVPELWDRFEAEVVDIQWFAGGGGLHTYVGLYRNGQIEFLAPSIGGRGLMSAVVKNGALYYTFSWGELVHRSQLGRLELTAGDRVPTALSGGFRGEDLFLSTMPDGSLKIEAGRFESFNRWNPVRAVGTIRQPTPADIELVGTDGTVIAPDYPR
jgi:hypothetical protein